MMIFAVAFLFGAIASGTAALPTGVKCYKCMDKVADFADAFKVLPSLPEKGGRCVVDGVLPRFGALRCCYMATCSNPNDVCVAYTLRAAGNKRMTLHGCSSEIDPPSPPIAGFRGILDPPFPPIAGFRAILEASGAPALCYSYYDFGHAYDIATCMCAKHGCNTMSPEFDFEGEMHDCKACQRAFRWRGLAWVSDAWHLGKCSGGLFGSCRGTHCVSTYHRWSGPIVPNCPFDRACRFCDEDVCPVLGPSWNLSCEAPPENSAFATWSCRADTGAYDYSVPPDMIQCRLPSVVLFARDVRRKALMPLSFSGQDAMTLADQAAEEGARVLTGSELSLVAESVNKLTTLSTRTLRNVTEDRRAPVVKAIVQKLIRTTSSLLHRDKADSWMDLEVASSGNRTAQRATGTSTAALLLTALEKISVLFGSHPAETLGQPSVTQSDSVRLESTTITEVKAPWRRFEALRPMANDSVALKNTSQLVPGDISATEDWVELPREALVNAGTASPTQVVVTSITDLGPLLPAPDGVTVVSRQLIAVNVVNGARTENLKRPVRLSMATEHPNLTSDSVRCVYWHQLQTKSSRVQSTSSVTTGYWSTEGCTVHQHNPSQTVCECYHLSVYAVLMDAQV